MPTPNPYARQYNTTAAQRYRRTRVRIPTPPNRSPSPNNTPPRTPPSSYPSSSPSHTTSTRKTRGYAGKPSTKHKRTKHKRTKHKRTKHKRTKKKRKHTAKNRRRRR